MSRGSASPYSTKRIKPFYPCGDYYINAFRGECYFKMLERLLDLGVYDELNIFYESNISAGLANWIENSSIRSKTYCEVIPEIRFVDDYITENSVIFVRGGFKHWYDFLLKYKNKNWLMLYAANTGREKWTFWDIVLNDISSQNNFVDRHGRYFFKFIKPTNEDIFYPYDTEQTIDICIGASHIHDRKGQYHVTEALKILRRGYKLNINAVLPGSSRGGYHSSKMFKTLQSEAGVEYLGYLSKKRLNEVFNKSKLFVHMGNHGQNDRSLLEAFATGTPIIYKSLYHHDPELERYCQQFRKGDNHSELAKLIKLRLEKWTPEEKEATYQKYKKHFGFEDVVIPRMAKLLDIMYQYGPNQTTKMVLTKIFKGNLCNL